MCYYHMLLSKNSLSLCTIILPWDEYKYERLPMKVCNLQEIFQAKMNKMFPGFEFIRAYINDLLIITKGDRSNHF